MFLPILCAVYLLSKKECHNAILLVASLIFYAWGEPRFLAIMLLSIIVNWAGAILIDKFNPATDTDDNQDKKNHSQLISKLILISVICINLANLVYFKYFNFLIDNFNTLFHGNIDFIKITLPLGISFYTFQATGYLVDVYWENIKAEKSYPRFLLFVSFFPQMTQGPISDFEQLSGELFAEHDLLYDNYSRGFQRMLWGFMKKLLLADLIQPYVTDVFANYSQYTGLTVLLGAFMYSVQIYADFSGYMDIMCGMCEMFGIHLAENFERPYFSKSVAEYWRRWHITLGAWFKRYIYYPAAMSNWSRKIAWASRDRFGKFFSDTLPATIALVIVWFCTGLWHGASWAYIAWGLVNGFFIILSLWLEKLYIIWKKALHINESKWAWRAFQTIRTFILVTFIKVLPEVGSLSDGWGLWMRIFTEHSIPHGIHELLPALAENGNKNFCIILAMILLQFIFSLLQRKKPVRDYFTGIPVPVRVTVMACCVIVLIVFGIPASATRGGFMYAQF